jgi:ABC-type sugar transport system permease subunit/outer membrane protein assembly factor BamB
MATAAIEQPVKSSAHTASRVVLAVSLILLVVLNAAYFLFLRPSGASVETAAALPGTAVLRAVALPGGSVAIVTTDNRLLLTNGSTIQAEKPLGLVVTHLAVAPDGSRVIGGSSDRKVLIWDDQLNDIGSFNINGRVTGLDVRDDGNIIASSSVGLFTGRSTIGLFTPAGEPLSSKRVGIDVTALQADASNVYYTDVQGNIAALTPESEWKQLWRKKLLQPATELELTAKGQLLTGDERGTVAMYSTDGKQAWAKTLSEYKIRMVHDDPSSGLILAGDSDGNLFALRSETGEPIFKTVLADGAARSFLQASDTSLTLMGERGNTTSVNLSAALGAQRQATIDAAVLGANAVLAVTAVSALVAAVPRLRAPALRTGKRIKQSRTAYLLILPSMLLIAVFAYYPTAMGLYFSFTNFNLSEPIKFNGLENFERLINDRFFWVGMGNMVLLLITGLIKAVTIPLLVAELVFWLRSAKLKYAMRTAFIIPSIVPGVVSVLLWKQIYQPNYGLLNEALKAIGLPQLQHAWLADEQTAIWAIIFAGFPWVGTFGFLILFGGLLNINRELFDAAEMDGASAWERFLYVDLPLLRPQLRLLLFFAFLGAAQEYGGIWIMTRGGPGTATYVPGLQMFLSISAGDFGYASAIGLVLAALVAVVTVTRFRFNQTPEAA